MNRVNPNSKTELTVYPYYKSVRLQKERSNSGYYLAKRVMDIVGAVIGLTLFSPVFAIVALLIKIEDPKGSVIFKQKRIGKREKPFIMFKFRSMVTDAEKQLDKLLDQNEVSGAMFKMKNDPRVTRIGYFIRKTSIDEFPQLWNVLRGEMSLVGPRPPLQREVDEYTNYHKQRLSVTPGCTGLWQCSKRNSVGFEEMVELDMQYITNQSVKNDIFIILKTFKSLIGSENAS